MYGKPQLYRRCRCHKLPVLPAATYGDSEEEKERGKNKRICMKTLRVISLEQTYLALKDSTEEYAPAPEAAVQKGLKLWD